MMLPAFQPEEVAGLAVYPEPPELVNRNNRGDALARRSLTISYVVEAEGEYRLPGEDFMWWDTENERAQVLSLEAVSFTVGQALAAGESTPAGLATLGRQQWLAIGTSLAGLLGVIYLRHRRLPGLIVLKARWQTCLARLKRLRQPALPERLNP